MVESDLRIAAILTNSRAEEWQRLRDNGLPVYEHEYADSITAYWGGADVNKTDWDKAWPYYLNAWKTRTSEMAMARFLQLSQFYWSGTTPAPVEALADSLYPQMQGNAQRWQTLRPTDIQYTYLRVLRLLVTLATICLCLYLLWQWLVRRKALSAMQYLYLIISGLQRLIRSATWWSHLRRISAICCRLRCWAFSSSFTISSRHTYAVGMPRAEYA